ncbi:hypothetical protein HanXRQr2_Chr04g0179371 [Helianthus annuus]|uniref:Uncharacterized protein n=1 Tax=Helianthus annuus TaxID=4232 RepID=A0A9K3J9G6_HELAN|nr:hypothetical protein HanXRQr2_Chr04g0179371 [Helianthus annuus]
MPTGHLLQAHQTQVVTCRIHCKAQTPFCKSQQLHSRCLIQQLTQQQTPYA